MIERLDVYLDHFGSKKLCGQLIQEGRNIYWKYSKDFLAESFNISPIKMRFTDEIQQFREQTFGGLFGVFHDSLPDGWGQLIIKRFLNSKGIPLDQQTTIMQLSCLSNTSQGALTYLPNAYESDISNPASLDYIYHSAMELYHQQKEVRDLDALFALGGSSGGARPKVAAWIHRDTHEIRFEEQEDLDFELNIVKFKSDTDYNDIAQIEHSYMIMARKAGLKVSASHIIKGEEGRNYFATKRFDRQEKNRIHMISAAGLLHDDYRLSNIDYGHIMDAAFRLFRDFSSYEDVLRLAIFNILAHNKDDHSKNVAFMADENGSYTLSPSYDLTFSYGINTYRSTSVAGEQQKPTRQHIYNLANNFGVKNVDKIIDEVRNAVSKWSTYAEENGVSENSLEEILRALERIDQSFFA